MSLTQDTWNVMVVKAHFLHEVEIHKFDGKDMRTWLNQLEQYFTLHQVPTDKKITFSSLYMEMEPFQWYRCIKRKWTRLSYKWENFVYDIIAQYEKVKTLDLQNVITNTQIRVKNNTIRKSTSMEEEGSIKMQGLQASRTSAQELDERKARGLCFNCDGKLV